MWKENGMSDSEGIYESTNSNNKYKLALVNNYGSLQIIYLSGGDSYVWNEGDIKAKITSTATANLYKATWYMANKTTNHDVYVTCVQGGLKTIFNQNNDAESVLYIKLFPTSENIAINGSKSLFSSGTGFAISSNGYIATNYHVIGNSSDIIIKGIKGDFNKEYKAVVTIKDANNDLAILKITDSKFTTLGTLPYNFNFNISDVGENVFALGYPLRASMGDEIKLTNGIISSKSGFQGDITTYQVSIPVQAGNSGGPMFNSNGQIIGVINAKHIGAENASYSIKSNYLNMLSMSLEKDFKFSSDNAISGLNLPEQVKFIKEFVYIIEAR